MTNPLLIYLRHQSKDKEYWEYKGNVISIYEIKEVINKIAITDPLLYRNIIQIFNPTNTKIIAEQILNVEKPTLFRNWEKAANLIMNRILNKDVIIPMTGIDVLQRDTIV